jgi:hypothetical protein
VSEWPVELGGRKQPEEAATECVAVRVWLGVDDIDSATVGVDQVVSVRPCSDRTPIDWGNRPRHNSSNNRPRYSDFIMFRVRQSIFLRPIPRLFNNPD